MSDSLITIRPLLEQARTELAGILTLEAGMLRDRQALLSRAWQLGRLLSGIKEIVGHGKWLFWLGGNWPEMTPQNAQRCMCFQRENPNTGNSGYLPPEEFSTDSIRKFMWGYIPQKERPELEGNENIAPHAHPLTFANNFLKWDRQAEQGLIKRPPVEVFRRDMEPIVKRIVELGGKDWLEKLLES